MCWSAPASLLFFGLGVVMNSLVLAYSLMVRAYYLSAFCVSWYWVMLMQLVDYFAWSSPSQNIVGGAVGVWGYFLNVTQIPVFGLCFLVVQPSAQLRFWGAVVIAMYVLLVVHHSNALTKEDLSIVKSNHLTYQWWRKMRTIGVAYLTSLTLLFLLLVRPLRWSIVVLATILVLYAISYKWYRPYLASMWCFFAVLVPIVGLFATLAERGKSVARKKKDMRTT